MNAQGTGHWAKSGGEQSRSDAGRRTGMPRSGPLRRETWGQSPGRVGTVGVGCLPDWGGEGSSGGFRRKSGGGGGGGTAPTKSLARPSRTESMLIRPSSSFRGNHRLDQKNTTKKPGLLSISSAPKEWPGRAGLPGFAAPPRRDRKRKKGRTHGSSGKGDPASSGVKRKKAPYIDRQGSHRIQTVASPVALRSSVPRRPAPPPFPVPAPAPTRRGTLKRAAACGCGPSASPAPRPDQGRLLP